MFPRWRTAANTLKILQPRETRIINSIHSNTLTSCCKLLRYGSIIPQAASRKPINLTCSHRCEDKKSITGKSENFSILVDGAISLLATILSARLQ